MINDNVTERVELANDLIKSYKEVIANYESELTTRERWSKDYQNAICHWKQQYYDTNEELSKRPSLWVHRLLWLWLAVSGLLLSFAKF